MGCGGTKYENLTYFDSENYNDGTCNAKICKCNKNVCQLRLDFETFVIAGPSTATDSNAHMVGGFSSDNNQANVMVIGYGACLTDAFVVSGATDKSSSPNICGTNHGQHCKRTENQRHLFSNF